MKSLNFFLVITALFLMCDTAFAQSSKANNKAIKATDKLDTELKSENPALALSESQRGQILELQTQRMEEISAFRKDNSNKEAVKAKTKALNKAMNGKIRKEILTAEQAKAQKEYRKKMKGKKGKGAARADKTSMKKEKKKTKRPVETMTDVEADEIYASASAKEKAKAEKATQKLNASLTASDANLALSVAQKKQINALNLKRIMAGTKMTNEGLSKEEMKVKNKQLSKSNKRTIMSILTKEQNAANKSGKKKKKK